MAKSLRSKVKKRLRTVKRGVVKSELAKPSSKLGVRETQKGTKLMEALSGYIKPAVVKKNAFRYDDADAEVPQHNWRQGPDYRSDKVEDAGYAVVGARRPKQMHGGDAPSARVVVADAENETMESAYEVDPRPQSKSQRKKGSGGPGHEVGVGGRPRKLARQRKKSGVSQGYGSW